MIIHDENQLFVQQLDMDEIMVEKKNLGQQDTQEGCFVSSRLTAPLASGESLTFEDMQGTEFQLIDSLKQLWQVQGLMQSSPEDSKWAFLLEWEEFSLEEKHSHYAKQAGHELHLFLFFKDKSYFELFVAPFLGNKFKKTFLDHWLLGNTSLLEGYLTNQSKLMRLEAHEVILLLHFVVYSGHPHLQQYGVTLANYANARARVTDKTAFNKLFDKVMKSKVNELVKVVPSFAPPT